MPATSQQGFSCAACILATGAVGLLCTFVGGAACASRVAGERFSTTMTAKAKVADFFVITDLRLTQLHTLGKVVSALQPPTTALQARGNKRSHFFVGCIVKENLLLSSTPEALRGLSEEALGLPVKICSRTSSLHGLHAGFGWEKATSAWATSYAKAPS